MPDTTINAPVAIDPVDRLALDAGDARALMFAMPATPGSLPFGLCMAEE